MGGGTPIYNICQSFHDNRIKYYRAPRNLPLMKNFEYAFLKSEGEFLIAMGADDGILPWALEELEKVIEQYSERRIFTWMEENYKWKDASGKYKRGEAGKAVLTGHTDFQIGKPEVIIYPAKDVFLDCCFFCGASCAGRSACLLLRGAGGADDGRRAGNG